MLGVGLPEPVELGGGPALRLAPDLVRVRVGVGVRVRSGSVVSG